MALRSNTKLAEVMPNVPVRVRVVSLAFALLAIKTISKAVASVVVNLTLAPELTPKGRTKISAAVVVTAPALVISRTAFNCSTLLMEAASLVLMRPAFFLISMTISALMFFAKLMVDVLRATIKVAGLMVKSILPDFCISTPKMMVFSAFFRVTVAVVRSRLFVMLPSTVVIQLSEVGKTIFKRGSTLIITLRVLALRSRTLLVWISMFPL